MGKIASLYADQIYLTDDNPRLENPNKIRKDIKRGINSKKISEISDRAKAISEAVKNLTTGNILLVCLLYTSPSPRDRTRSRMPSSA